MSQGHSAQSKVMGLFLRVRYWTFIRCLRWCYVHLVFRDPLSPAPASAHEEAIASSRLSLPTGFGRGRCPPVTLMRFCRWAGWLVPVRMDFFVGDMVSVDETTIQFNH